MNYDNLYYRYFYPFPTLTTDRLILRKLTKNDAQSLYEYCSSSRAAQYSLWTPHSSVSETKSFLKYLVHSAHRGEYMTWGIVLKSSGELIGTCGYTYTDDDFKIAELGYGIKEKHYGNGYATEAMKAVIDYGFCTVGFVRQYAKVMVGNTPSVKLLERLGFIHEGNLKKGIIAKDKATDVSIYAMCDDDYEKIINK